VFSTARIALLFFDLIFLNILPQPLGGTTRGTAWDDFWDGSTEQKNSVKPSLGRVGRSRGVKGGKGG